MGTSVCLDRGSGTSYTAANMTEMDATGNGWQVQAAKNTAIR
jgi:hypothetical protein